MIYYFVINKYLLYIEPNSIVSYAIKSDVYIYERASYICDSGIIKKIIDYRRDKSIDHLNMKIGNIIKLVDSINNKQYYIYNNVFFALSHIFKSDIKKKYHLNGYLESYNYLNYKVSFNNNIIKIYNLKYNFLSLWKNDKYLYNIFTNNFIIKINKFEIKKFIFYNSIFYFEFIKYKFKVKIILYFYLNKIKYKYIKNINELNYNDNYTFNDILGDQDNVFIEDNIQIILENIVYNIINFKLKIGKYINDYIIKSREDFNKNSKIINKINKWFIDFL